jgi:hypothetical protein
MKINVGVLDDLEPLVIVDFYQHAELLGKWLHQFAADIGEPRVHFWAGLRRCYRKSDGTMIFAAESG